MTTEQINGLKMSAQSHEHVPWRKEQVIAFLDALEAAQVEIERLAKIEAAAWAAVNTGFGRCSTSALRDALKGAKE